MHQLLFVGCSVEKDDWSCHSVKSWSVAFLDTFFLLCFERRLHCLYSTLTETCHSLPRHVWHRVHREIFLPTSLFETSRLIGSVKGLAHTRIVYQPREARALRRRGICLGGAGKTGWPHTDDQHVIPHAAHLTSGSVSKWPPPTPAGKTSIGPI